MLRTLSFCLLVWLLTPGGLYAQAGTSDPAAPAFADPVARELVERARAAREQQGRSIRGYTAVVRERSVVRLRLPLKVRTLVQSESAARVHWSRDDESIVELLGSRVRSPDGVGTSTGISPNMLFDPRSDRLYLGVGSMPDSSERSDRSVRVAHPLAPDSERHYRYESGDTLSIRLADGRLIRAVELRVLPRHASYRFLEATLRIEPQTGALVQAAYRPARALDVLRDSAFVAARRPSIRSRVPGSLKPLQGEVDLVVVEYSLWDQKHWLPRLMRIEGHVRAGALRVPFGSEVAYRMERIADDDAPNERGRPSLTTDYPPEDRVERSMTFRGRPVRVYRPRDRALLLKSEELPPAFGESAPDFASGTELKELLDRVEAIGRMSRFPPSYTVEWGGGGSGLLRYNRVEGLSAGVRGRVGHRLGEAAATVRLGTADLDPNLALEVMRPVRGRTVALDLHHRLEPMDRTGRDLGLGNSLNALLLGRDDGEYHRTTGFRLALEPQPTRRRSYRAEAYVERHRPVETGTDWSLSRLFRGDRTFRPTVAAEEGTLAGTALTLAPWWGPNPSGSQGGVEIFVEAAGGDFDFLRASATGRAALPLADRFRIGTEVALGSSTGQLPVQRNWWLGGARTLRGYPAYTLAGSSFARSRVEVARRTPFGSLAVFQDAAWAGPDLKLRTEDALLSAGAGLSLLDGLIRVDVARPLRGQPGWRLELSLDAFM
jgi:hypothetical protein